MLKTGISLTLMSFVVWMACTNDGSKPKMLNPNGDSELAVLMRNMFDEGMVVKQNVINGDNSEMKLAYHRINTATPTEEGKNATTEYQLFAKAYEASVEHFKQASEKERPPAYQNMVDNCMSCHKTVCPGPTMKIKKMYLSESEMKVAAGE